jgi:hypothetical protein
MTRQTTASHGQKERLQGLVLPMPNMFFSFNVKAVLHPEFHKAAHYVNNANFIKRVRRYLDVFKAHY